MFLSELKVARKRITKLETVRISQTVPNCVTASSLCIYVRLYLQTATGVFTANLPPPPPPKLIGKVRLKDFTGILYGDNFSHIRLKGLGAVKTDEFSTSLAFCKFCSSYEHDDLAILDVFRTLTFFKASQYFLV